MGWLALLLLAALLVALFGWHRAVWQRDCARLELELQTERGAPMPGVPRRPARPVEWI